MRARNIKTVGDLSALSPNEIKLLPIRSPKVSNLKKALKTYHEHQVQWCPAKLPILCLADIVFTDNLSLYNLSLKRKGRPDDLKSFDEMEKMTSELEETTTAPNQEEKQMPGDEKGTS